MLGHTAVAAAGAVCCKKSWLSMHIQAIELCGRTCSASTARPRPIAAYEPPSARSSSRPGPAVGALPTLQAEQPIGVGHPSKQVAMLVALGVTDDKPYAAQAATVSSLQALMAAELHE
jgi:hypothetical protein